MRVDPQIAEKLIIALVHHPIVNKDGKVVTTSVTTLDVHDMARLCKTYGVASLFIVTPIPAQKRLVERLARHWTEGSGGIHNPHRKEALTMVKVVDSIDDIIDNLSFGSQSGEITLVSTSAKSSENSVSYSTMREKLKSLEKVLLLFGTGHGLASSVMERVDIRLDPIEGAYEFNHLPVRSAASVIIDRLLGQDD